MLSSITSVYDSLNSIFSTREIAIFIWIAAFILYLIFKHSFGKLFWDLVKSLFIYEFILIYALAWLYTLIGVYLLDCVGLWNPSETKDLIFWLLFAATTSLYNIKKVREGKAFFRAAVFDNLKFSIIIEFVVANYTFDLLIELLIIIPVSIFLALILVVSESKPELKKVTKIINFLIASFGLYILIRAVYYAVINLHELSNLNTVEGIILSPILAIWFLPFLLALSTYITYEVVFVTMGNAIKSTKLLRYAKWQGLIHFGLDSRGLERWRNSLFRKDITSKNDIRDSIQKIKQAQLRERNPPNINYNNGWSPYKAKDFLLLQNIPTGNYDEMYGNEWHAISTYIKIDKDLLSNNIAYCVIGEEFVAKKLELVLNIYNLENQGSAIHALLEKVQELYIRALNRQVPDRIVNSIKSKSNLTINDSNVEVSVRREDWEGFKQGITLFFSIRHL